MANEDGTLTPEEIAAQERADEIARAQQADINEEVELARREMGDLWTAFNAFVIRRRRLKGKGILVPGVLTDAKMQGRNTRVPAAIFLAAVEAIAGPGGLDDQAATPLSEGGPSVSDLITQAMLKE